MSNNGRDYEQFVARLQQALLDAESITRQKNVKIQLNKKIVDSCGISREFDLYWEYELAGITYKTVIECKDYNSLISVEKIDALIGKIKDIPDLKAVFATKNGYQSGAETKAEHNKIDLLIVREQNTSDWRDIHGAPLIKNIQINIKILAHAQITEFRPLIDGDWARENLSEQVGPVSISGLNNEIFVEIEDTGQKYSLYELQGRLSPSEGEAYGSFKKEERFDRGWIVTPNTKFKINGYNVSYTISQPHEELLTISPELAGVIEYLHKGTKKSVFRNGIIKDGLLSPRR